MRMRKGGAVTLGDVRAAIENAEAVVAVLNPSEQFLTEFAQRRRAIGRAVIAQSGADSQAAAAGDMGAREKLAEVSRKLAEPDSARIVLGTEALAKFEELVTWLRQQGLHSLSG